MILEEKYSVRPPYRRYTEDPSDTDEFKMDNKQIDKLTKELYERHKPEKEPINLWRQFE
jgi:hypothetical protein